MDKLFVVKFDDGRPDMLVYGKTTSQVSRDMKRYFGHGDVDDVDNISDTDAEIEFGMAFDKVALMTQKMIDEAPLFMSEKSKSKAQQKLFGIIHSIQKGNADADDFDPEIQKMAKDIKKKSVKKMASTKHKGLPDKKAEADMQENKITIDTEKDGKSDEKEAKVDTPKIDKNSPDANGDGQVDAKDDLNKDGKVDAKDLKIAELEKDLKIRRLQKSIEAEDDPIPEMEKPKLPTRLRIRDRDDRFECVNAEGTCVKTFEYDGEKTSSRSAHTSAKDYVESEYAKAMKGIVKEEISEMKVSKIKKLDKKIINMLKSLDTDEAKMIIQGLPKNLRKNAMAALGLKESDLDYTRVDGRTKAYKETAKRLMAKKAGTEEVDEAGYPMKPAGTYDKNDKDFDQGEPDRSGKVPGGESIPKRNASLEEEDSLAELSRKTLASYQSKASDASKHRKLSTKKVDNRYSGVSRASRKLDKKNRMGEDDHVEEGDKPGLWDNIHAKRKRGEKPAKPGEKGYPKTLDIEDDVEPMDEKGVCWDGYERVPGTVEGEPGSCQKIGEDSHPVCPQCGSEECKCNTVSEAYSNYISITKR